MIDVIVLGLLLGGVFALVSVGLTLIFGVMDVINFAHGEFVMLGMMLTALLTRHVGISAYLAGLIVIAGSIPFTWLIFHLVIRPTLGRSLYVQVFATLGLSILLVAGTLMVFGPDTVAINDPLASTRLEIFGVSVELGRVIAFAVALVLVAALWVVLQRTRFGRELRAVAQDDFAAQIVGIRVSRAYVWSFVLGSVFAVAAGAVIVPFQAVTPNSGFVYVLVSFVVVVLGGFGSVPGALAGGLLIGLVQTATGFYLGTRWMEAALFLVFMVVLLLRPQGLFGKKSAGGEMVGAR